MMYQAPDWLWWSKDRAMTFTKPMVWLTMTADGPSHETYQLLKFKSRWTGFARGQGLLNVCLWLNSFGICLYLCGVWNGAAFNFFLFILFLFSYLSFKLPSLRAEWPSKLCHQVLLFQVLFTRTCKISGWPCRKLNYKMEMNQLIDAKYSLF